MPNLPRETWTHDTLHIGRRALVYDEVESTNSLAAGFALGGTDVHGVALVADHQRAGRGQYGRAWQSRPRSSLLMSVVLRPPPELRRPVILTAWAAVGVAEAVLALTGAQAKLKWPNDLLIQGKKVCGILIEQTSTATGLTTVAGIGLNLNQTAEEFAAAELPNATSLGVISGKPVESRAAAAAVLQKLDFEYTRLLAGERVALEADWKWRIGLLGRPVVVEVVGGATATGRLLDMSFDGLEVADDGGFVRVIAPESVVHLRAA